MRQDKFYNTEELLKWCDIIVATGSTIVNKTITSLLVEGKPTIFFGTTLADELMGLERFCPCSN